MSCMKFFACVFLLTICGCAAVKTVPLVFTPGSQIDTLSTAVSISIHNSAGSTGGHGYLIYRRPDQFHLVMLSPFGSTMLEAFALGDRLTLVYTSQKTAYTGSFDELADTSGMQEWRLLRWVMDADPSKQAGFNGSINRSIAQGGWETVTYESGLVTVKSTPAGDRVFYRDYVAFNGVPLPSELEIFNSRSDRIQLKLEEPEVNVALDATVFTPRLDEIKVYPLSALPVQ